MRYKIEVAGYKNWKVIKHKGWAEIDGEPISKIYEIEVDSYEEAEDEAIRKFESNGYYFNEIVA